MLPFTSPIAAGCFLAECAEIPRAAALERVTGCGVNRNDLTGGGRENAWLENGYAAGEKTWPG